MKDPWAQILASYSAHFHFFQFQKLVWGLEKFTDNYQPINKRIISFENKFFLKFPSFGFSFTLLFLSFNANITEFLISTWNLKAKLSTKSKFNPLLHKHYMNGVTLSQDYIQIGPTKTAPLLINTIEMRVRWMEIKYIKSAFRLLDRDCAQSALQTPLR